MVYMGDPDRSTRIREANERYQERIKTDEYTHHTWSIPRSPRSRLWTIVLVGIIVMLIVIGIVVLVFGSKHSAPPLAPSEDGQFSSNQLIPWHTSTTTIMHVSPAVISAIQHPQTQT